MNFEIVELEELSGPEASIYSIILENDTLTLFDHFIEKNTDNYRKEIDFIEYRLEKIGFETGAREHFFKLNEGKPGDGICALYDMPGCKLRLYCIRYGSVAIILGGGSAKPKNIRVWQDDAGLKEEVELMIKVSKEISKAFISGELSWSKGGRQLLGNLKFSKNE